MPPEIVKISLDGRRISSQQKAEPDQRQQGRHLREGEHVLHHRAGADAPRVDRGQQHQHRDCQQLLRGQPDLPCADQIIARRDPRHEHSCELGKRHRHRRDGSGLNHQEQRPTVEEAGERTKRFPQIDVLSAGVRHSGREFAVAQRRRNRQRCADQPDHDQQAR